MRTIALRFGEHIAPPCGTIAAHEEIIEQRGYVWYGKMGTPISEKMILEIMKADRPKILLIRSGKTERYWASVLEIKREVPKAEEIPANYRDMSGKFKTWFKICKFDLADKGIMSKCRVASSGNQLGEVSKHSMSPYFIIDTEE